MLTRSPPLNPLLLISPSAPLPLLSPPHLFSYSPPFPSTSSPLLLPSSPPLLTLCSSLSPPLLSAPLLHSSSPPLLFTPFSPLLLSSSLPLFLSSSLLPYPPSLSLQSASDVISLYYQIVSRPFYEHESSKFFACGRHLKKTTRLIKLPVPPLDNPILVLKFLYKVPQMLSVFITKSFLGHSTSMNHQNFLPAAGI